MRWVDFSWLSSRMVGVTFKNDFFYFLSETLWGGTNIEGFLGFKFGFDGVGTSTF